MIKLPNIFIAQLLCTTLFLGLLVSNSAYSVENWKAEYQEEFATIPLDGLTVPIRAVNRYVTVSNARHERFVISRG